MRNATRLIFNDYVKQIGLLNSVEDVTKKFAVAPTIQQKLEQKIQQSSQFLSKINIMGVSEMEGEKIGLGISGPVAGRTDTTKNDRETRDLINLDNQKYKAVKTDFDTHITYAKIDQWAKFPDFQNKMRDVILKQQTLDRIMIGWNGKISALQTDRAAYPLLQDVNIGWLEQFRINAPARVMKEVKAGSGKIKVGPAIGKDDGYKTLDALVFDAVNDLIDPVYSEDSELVVICGRQLLSDKYFPILNSKQDPSEQLAADIVISQKRMGNLPVIRVPYFPANALLITRLDNLSIYYQEGARRRSVVDNAKRDRVENYESSNEAYVVENFAAGCVVENIELVAE